MPPWRRDWQINFTPDGSGGEFFKILEPYAPPPPPGAMSPLRWGHEKHVRTLLGSQLASLELSQPRYFETGSSAPTYCELFRQTFGSMIATRAGLADQPERLAALDRDFLQFVTRWNRTTAADRVELPYEHVLVVGRKRS